MLRIALIESIQSLAVTALADLRERQLADFWANRLIAANRRDANQLFAILAELAATETCPSPYFSTQLVGLLYDEAAALAPIQIWLERTHKLPLHDLNLREQNRQTREQLSCGNAFTSLRQLALLDWREIFEKLSRVEQVLRGDPSGVYAGMDFATRDRCRRAIEEIAQAASQTEEEVAERVIGLATQSQREATTDKRRSYVGTWLVGEGRAQLTRLLACPETRRYRTLEWIYRHHAAVYSLGIAGLSALLLIVAIALIPGSSLVGLPPAIRLGLVLLLLIPVSQLAIEVGLGLTGARGSATDTSGHPGRMGGLRPQLSARGIDLRDPGGESARQRLRCRLGRDGWAARDRWRDPVGTGTGKTSGCRPDGETGVEGARGG
jgi:cyclic beta-1,2-glucan synthetase